jgi:hypothetical protein
MCYGASPLTSRLQFGSTPMDYLHATNRFRMIDNPMYLRMATLVPNANTNLSRYLVQQWFEGDEGRGEWRTAGNSQLTRPKKKR